MVEESLQTQSSSHEISPEDLISGMNEWRNIQDVVRITLKSFYDTLKRQGEAIREIQARLDSKLDKCEFEEFGATQDDLASLEHAMKSFEEQMAMRPDRKDMINEVQKRTTLIEHTVKATAHESQKSIAAEMEKLEQSLSADLKSVKSSLKGKVSVDRFRSELETKASVAEVGEVLDGKIDKLYLQKAIEKVRHNLSVEINKKADKMKTESAIAKLQIETEDMSKSHSKFLKELSSSKAETKALNIVRDVLSEEIQGLRQSQHDIELRLDADSHTAATAFKSISSSFDSHIAELQQIVDDEAHNLSSLKEVVDQRIAAAQGAVDRMKVKLDDKIDVAEFEQELENKADIKHVARVINDHLESKASMENFNILSAKVERLQIQNDCRFPQDGGISQPVMEAICAAVDRKANLEDINKVFENVQNDIDSKIDRMSFETAVRDQSIINASLCAESSVARWIWKTGKTKSGHLVPWNVQSVNTDPGNFIWDKDKTVIVAVTPGLYEITAGFFTRRKPLIQILVNGETIIEANNLSSYIGHNSSGSWAGVGRHTAGVITGSSLVDYLSLPHKARISVTYNGSESVEAFLSLRKL